MPDDRLWTLEEAAAYLGVPEKTLYAWRARGKGPRAKKIGRYLRFAPEDVKGYDETPSKAI